jgi:addiction module HigA family antidote
MYMGRMHNPPHPGESIREDILPALGITVTEAANQLGVARVTLSRLINGQSGISADMARRLEAWLGGPNRGPSAESWLRTQADYDLWQAMQQPAPKVVRARRVAS